MNGPYEKIEGTFPFWDPDLFLDDDGRLYFYWGCSCSEPIYGVELDPETMKPKTEKKALIDSDAIHNGFERNGDDNHVTLKSKEEAEQIFLQKCRKDGVDESRISPEHRMMAVDMIEGRPFIEGSWMTKHDSKYYLQYAITGTEYNVYADGVYVSDSPLGPFTLAESNPYSLKLGGFIEGAGHGSTMRDKEGAWWHTATQRISIHHPFERRVGLWPAGFDDDGNLFCNQRYGDWPIAVSDAQQCAWAKPEWYLLSYKARMLASSFTPGKEPDHASDENVRTWWQAGSSRPGEWLLEDLGENLTVHAVQINFADDVIEAAAPGIIHEEAGRYIDAENRRTRWMLEGSLDGNEWFTVCDKSKAETDLSHDFIVEEQGIKIRYLRLTVFEVPFGVKPCVSGLRVFGKGNEEAPERVCFDAVRKDPMTAEVRIHNADDPKIIGYSVQWGCGSDKLYHSKMVFRDHGNVINITSLIEGKPAFIRVDTFGKGGITEGKEIVKV